MPGVGWGAGREAGGTVGCWLGAGLAWMLPGDVAFAGAVVRDSAVCDSVVCDSVVCGAAVCGAGEGDGVVACACVAGEHASKTQLATSETQLEASVCLPRVGCRRHAIRGERRLERDATV